MARERAAWEEAVNSPMRKMGFYFGLAFVFLRLSMLHETLARLIGMNTYLALITGIPAVTLSILGGGAQRSMETRSGKFWMGFLFFLACSVPFSSWQSESFGILTGYIRGDFPILFMLGGMVLTWKEFKMVMGALAISAVATMSMERLFADMGGGRLTLDTGTIGNSNDYAAHLILLLPFLLWAVMQGSKFFKPVALGLLIGGLFIALKTGSRGGLLALLAGFGFILLRGTGRIRWILGAAAPIAFVVIIGFLPASVMSRYSVMFGDKSGPGAEDVTGAEESTTARRELLMESLRFTFEHPVFGVGAGNFSSFEGGTAQAAGHHGRWQETHNTYTEVSSETGIPATICFLGGIICALFSANKILTTARRNKLPAVVAAAFCCALSLAMVCVAMAFLALAYRFYLPALSGLIIALGRVVQMEFLNKPAPLPPAGPRFDRRARDRYTWVKIRRSEGSAFGAAR